MTINERLEYLYDICKKENHDFGEAVKQIIVEATAELLQEDDIKEVICGGTLIN